MSTLIQSALAGLADLVVTDSELRVLLARSARRTARGRWPRCTTTWTAAPASPGSRLRLRYAVASPTGAEERTISRGPMSGDLDSETAPR